MHNTPYDTDNVFAKILRGEIPCNKVYEDDYALAFHDIAPQAAVHVVVIPKGAYTDYQDFCTRANDDMIAGYARAVHNAAKTAGVAEEGWRSIINIGRNANREVPHLHTHILGGENLGPLRQKNQ